MPSTKIMHFRGNTLIQSGGVAGMEFDVQPVLNVSGSRYDVIEVSLGNNPGCSTLNGNTKATIADGMAIFTDLWIDKAARGYTLKFCAGQCSSISTSPEASDFYHAESAPFDVQPGRLRIVQEPGQPETGVPIQAEVEVEHVTSYGGVRNLEAFTDYNFSVTVTLDGVAMSGRRTLWPVKGRVKFTDLIITVANKPQDSGFRLVYRSCGGTAELRCLPSFVDLHLSGQAMLAVSASFRVQHTAPSKVRVVTQPGLTLAGRAIGSECVNQVGITCKKFKVKDPPIFKLVDRFENNVDTGSWFACATLLRNSSTGFIMQPLLGTTRVNLHLGNATFDSLHILEVKSDYVLNVTVHKGESDESCDSNGFGWVLSDTFDVTFATATQLFLITDINTTAGAGTPFSQMPKVALQDDNGNTVLQGDDIDIFAQISSYRPDPRAPRDATGLSLFALCTFNPFTGNNENCKRFERLATQSSQGIADLAQERVDGSLKESTMHVQYMGYYTFRFYAEALITYSHEFFVMNDLGATMQLVAQPGVSSCAPGIAGHTDWRCSSGGLLEPQPRFEVFDQFGNKALYGVQEFMVSIFVNPGGGFLLCDQRYKDPVTKKAVYSTCLHSSLDGILQFTDLRIDSIARGYVLRVEGTGRSHPHNGPASSYWSSPAENKMVESVLTNPFDVFAARSVKLISTPSATPAGCSAYPPPVLQMIGFDNVDAEQESEIDFEGGTGVVFTFGCTDESDDVVLQTGREYSFVSGIYKKHRLINEKPSYKLILTSPQDQ